MHIIKNCGCVAVVRDVNWGFDLAPSLCNPVIRPDSLPKEKRQAEVHYSPEANESRITISARFSGTGRSQTICCEFTDAVGLFDPAISDLDNWTDGDKSPK